MNPEVFNRMNARAEVQIKQPRLIEGISSSKLGLEGEEKQSPVSRVNYSSILKKLKKQMSLSISHFNSQSAKTTDLFGHLEQKRWDSQKSSEYEAAIKSFKEQLEGSQWAKARI